MEDGNKLSNFEEINKETKFPFNALCKRDTHADRNNVNELLEHIPEVISNE
jgi:hypothetical protein